MNFSFFFAFPVFTWASLTFEISPPPPPLYTHEDKARKKNVIFHPINFTCVLKVVSCHETKFNKTRSWSYTILRKVICHDELELERPSIHQFSFSRPSIRSLHDHIHQSTEDSSKFSTRIWPQAEISQRTVVCKRTEPKHIKYETPRASADRKGYCSITTTFNAESFMCWEIVYRNFIIHENFLLHLRLDRLISILSIILDSLFYFEIDIFGICNLRNYFCQLSIAKSWDKFQFL